MNWWLVIKRELRQIFIRDPRRVVFLFGSSLAYLVFFGMLYGTHVITAVPLVVCDEDQTSLSRGLVQAFEDSEKYRIVAHVATIEEMEALLQSKEAYAALNIPARFSRDVKTGLSSQVLVIANGSNIAVANTIVSSGQEILAAYSQKVAASTIEQAGQMPGPAAKKVAPVDLRLRVLNNPTLSYLNYFLLGLAMAALQAGILLSTGASIMDEYGQELKPQEVATYKYWAAKLLPYWGCGIVGYGLTLTVSQTIFAVPNKGNLFELLLLGTAFTFVITAMGSLIAASCRNEVSYTQVVLSYAVPAFVLSGYIWPVQAMDVFSSLLSYAVPLTYTADNLRGLMVAGYAPRLYSDVAILFGLGTVFFWLATKVYDRKMAFFEHHPVNQDV